MVQTAVAGNDTGLPMKELAKRHGLSAAGALPSLPAYLRQLWAYRHFIGAYANAKVSSSLGNTRLGMFWQVLTPLFNAAVYYLIFGVILSGTKDMDNFIAYLCTGVFVFGFTQSVVQSGVVAVTNNLGLIRALHFPRASLPLAVVMVEARNLAASMAVLMSIVLITGEPLTVEWLLIVPALLLQTIFNTGLAMLSARLGSKITDIKQLVPFIMRIWMYSSAVIYSVELFERRLDGWALRLVEANPMLVYIELMRHALMEDVPLAGSPTRLWIQSIVWALIVGVGGFIYFWRGEKGYGRG
ncbi:teichoic acid transport system permease protein [Krasilnikovia cinnamomea]|uniref:Transport permease protein n=1 Tax=Krasilnikovia cinnamomea TaxID=349313 RepID=A0A4Q7ZMX6_9ACTN|nr:ABC transporter permease [Krasilnikovia cinnamomea]RZU51715.1 teichoic acid transport system permease protein [Krasilnikovia cinnamomea]